MQYLFDEDGRRYLDAFAGIVTVSLGHCHPEFVEALHRQNSLLQHCTTIHLNHQVAEYAEELAAKMPGNLKVQISPLCVFLRGSTHKVALQIESQPSDAHPTHALTAHLPWPSRMCTS